MSTTLRKQSSEKIFLYSFSLVVMLLVVIASTSLFLVRKNNADIQQAIKSQNAIINHIHELRTFAADRGVILLSALNTEDVFERDDLIQEYNEIARHFLKVREQLNRYTFTDAQQQTYEHALTVVGDLAKVQRVVISLAEENRLSEARQIAVEQVIPTKDKVYEAYDNFDKSIQNQVEALLEKSGQTVVSTLIYSLFFIGLSLIIAAWVSRYVFLYIRNSEKSLFNINLELEKKNAAKSEFIARMSHELRTPMNVIMGFTQVLLYKKDELKPNHIEALNDIYKASERLLDLINEVLDIQSIDSGIYKLDYSEINLQEVVSNITQIMTPQLDERNIQLDLAGCDAPLRLFTDLHSLKHILLNLISNAITYNKDNGKIFIRCQQHGNQIMLSIHDTGIGIPADKLEDVFEPFDRLGKGENIPGAGIGLTVTKKLVDLLGAEISVESVVDQGTTFTVNFPADAHTLVA